MVNMWFVLLLMLNFGISWWNARSVGAVWSESKEIGGSMRALAVAGYVMAIAGFTMVYGFFLMLIAIVVHPVIPFLAENVPLENLLVLTSDLLYVLIVFAIIPSGIVIWLHSVVSFWRRKTLGGGLVAGYNTYANVRNIVNASRELPSAFGRITETLFGGKGKKKGNEVLVLLALLILVLAVLSGYFTASAIMKKADREVDLFAGGY